MRRQFAVRIVDLKHSEQGTTFILERTEPIPLHQLRLSLIDGYLETVTTSDLVFDELEPVFQTVMRVVATLDGPEETEQKVLVGFRRRQVEAGTNDEGGAQ